MHGINGPSLQGLIGYLRQHWLPTLPGAETPRAWLEGRFLDVATHCLDDARTLRAVVARLREAR